MLLRLLQAAVLALAVATLGRLAAPLHPLLDLFSHLTLYLAAAAVACAGLLALARRWVWAALAFGVAAAVLLPSRGLLQVPPAGGPRFEDLTVMQFNARYGNREIGDFVVAVLRDPATRPQIIVVEEASPLVLSQLLPLYAIYPHKLARVEFGPYGVALFSELPILADESRRMPNDRNHYLRLRLRLPETGVDLGLIEVHTVSPLGFQAGWRRNTELGFIARLAAQVADGPTILVGDLNVTPYSPQFRALERDSGLASNLRGRWPVGTWPNWLPAWAAIPIDHLLVSPQIQVLDRRVGPSFGSDHYAVTTRLRVFDQSAVPR
jgi:endonuclease/exonuclease/phosphatase (EEP) superfamily protein YafD